MYSASITVLLIAVAVIHLIPVKGLLGAEALRTLYQVDVADPNLLILMRHRACLFGVVGLLLIYAAFVREHQWLAVVLRHVDNQQPLMDIHLCRSQPDSRRVIHGFEHVVDEGT